MGWSRRLLWRGVAIAAGAEGGGVLLVRAAMVEHHPPEKEHLPEVAPVGAEAGRTVAAPAFLPTPAGKLGTMLQRARKREHVPGAGQPIGRQVERIVRLDEVRQLHPPGPDGRLVVLGLILGLVISFVIGFVRQVLIPEVGGVVPREIRGMVLIEGGASRGAFRAWLYS